MDSIKTAEGDVLVLDKGAQIWQFNRKGSAGKERFRAAEFIRSIVEERQKTTHLKTIGKIYPIVSAFGLIVTFSSH